MEWVDPGQVLINLRWLELNLPAGLDDKVRRFRTNKLKELREARTAALFAYGMGKAVLQTPTAVAKVEAADFDFIMRWQADDKEFFYPVQLKELPPEDLNADATLEDLYDKLEKYSGADNLSVLIHLNRAVRFDYHPWDRPTCPNILELWYLACTSEDQSKWLVYGSALKPDSRPYDFDYPTGEPNVA